jgi:hypothetical protein
MRSMPTPSARPPASPATARRREMTTFDALMVLFIVGVAVALAVGVAG